MRELSNIQMSSLLDDETIHKLGRKIMAAYPRGTGSKSDWTIFQKMVITQSTIAPKTSPIAVTCNTK